MMENAVRIKNLLGQTVKISLKRPNTHKPVEVTLRPYELLPNPRRPYSIGADEITEFTEGLVKRKFVRLTKVA